MCILCWKYCRISRKSPRSNVCFLFRLCEKWRILWSNGHLEYISLKALIVFIFCTQLLDSCFFAFMCHLKCHKNINIYNFVTFMWNNCKVTHEITQLFKSLSHVCIHKKWEKKPEKVWSGRNVFVLYHFFFHNTKEYWHSRVDL